ncbi:Transcription factor bHLH155 [Apostasia shenzhenica]|uniref:Transcription factor bHLH155 n=1 Tax=Apostasia shenzhenica TaxID=1088818 RepID=A0A2I0AAT0_9ASPA|nr:Transcription factor bHLH155 [Apostasia shenzhenica]
MSRACKWCRNGRVKLLLLLLLLLLLHHLLLLLPPMDEQQLNPLAITHLLQHTLRSLCIHDNSHWVYAVFWRILPRNFPPPKWDLQAGTFDRLRGNRRNWILVWEDGFCNFAASAFDQVCSSSLSVNGEAAGAGAGDPAAAKGLQPELFFKMSHEIYNYGEGLIGKVAADHSHKWIHKDPHEQEINFLTSNWSNPADSQPRTWEAQFQSGIKTIALIAVREGVVQLGAVNKVMEDLSYVVFLRKKFAYLESIPGVLLPHPSSASVGPPPPPENWPAITGPIAATVPAPPALDAFGNFSHPMRIAPSMSSLEALLSKLPSVGPVPPLGSCDMPVILAANQRPPPPVAGERLAKEEEVEEYDGDAYNAYYGTHVSKLGEEYN